MRNVDYYAHPNLRRSPVEELLRSGKEELKQHTVNWGYEERYSRWK